MELTESKLSKFDFLPEINTLYWEWQKETKHAEWKTIQKELTLYADMAIKYKAETHIVNEKMQYFTFIPEYQKWIDTNISTRTNKYCKRFALIKSDDFFIEVAARQVFEEENSSKFELELFPSYEEAVKWVKSRIKNS